MKALLIFSSVLALLSPLSLGTDLYYTGAVDEWWEDGRNWNEGSLTGATHSAQPTRGDKCYIGSDKSVKLGNCNWENKLYGIDFYIAAGGKLTVESSDRKFWNSSFTVEGKDGLVFSGNSWLDYPNTITDADRHPMIFNLGSAGSVLYSGAVHNVSGAHLGFTGTLNLMFAGEYSVQRRTLVSYTGVVDGGEFNFSNITGDFGSGTTRITDGNLTVDENHVGDYKLGYDSTNKVMYVDYVTGNQSIPEPTTAALSLLGLAGLMMRRRRC
ncbi:MAG: PEP-CTERM sorting domain-containing protein [Akkermansia sp.]